ncbi:MAG: acyl-CoA dehydrogenase family protein [Alphaproteobacteria bacterium]|nr:acyl-CoA dehydrogenase family protein [Alphaproteobacteria bacterium]
MNDLPIFDAQQSGSDYVARARALAPMIAAAAPEIEAQRELTPQVVSALHQAGLFRLFVPRWLDGGEAPLSTYVQVIEAIARGDASTAWCLSQMNVCAISAMYLNPEAAREVLGKPGSALAWGSSSDCKAVRVPGGYRVSGTWDFGSGCHHATWLGAHCPVVGADGDPLKDEKGQPAERTLLVPKSAATVVDVWDVLGLRGTGSDRYVLNDVFVPDQFTITTLTRWPDAERLKQGIPYRFTASSLYASGFGSVALGNARGMLDSFIELATKKVARWTRNSLADNALVQAGVAEAYTKLESARIFMVQNLREVEETLLTQEAPTIHQRVRIRAAGTSAIRTATAVANHLYEMAGTTSIFADNLFQRRFRDAHTVSQHLQGRASHFENIGKHLLGKDVELRFI